MNMQSFLTLAALTMRAERTERNPNMAGGKDTAADREWNATARHWRITFRRSGRGVFSTYFSQGSGHTKEPTAADVLDCLASDAAGFENAGDFEEWASEYGYDTDSRSAERTYRTIEKQADKLRRFLGEDLYGSLLWDTERL